MIDIHAHYDDEAFDEDRYELLNDLFANKGVKAIINAGCDLNTSLSSLNLSEKHDGIYAAVGIHPQEVNKYSEKDLFEIEKLLSCDKAVAVGEIGLDYHYGADDDEKRRQKELFEIQLELAKKHNLPVVIHERDAISDCLEIVKKHDVRGVFHSFSGSKEIADILLKRGWYISFSGTVTFKNARIPVENAVFVPEDRILTETDCPYLTAHPFRGKRNDSGIMRYTLEKLAELRNVSFEDVETITENNAKTLFNI